MKDARELTHSEQRFIEENIEFLIKLHLRLTKRVMRGSFSLQKYSRLKKDTEVGMVELEYHHFITSSEVMYLENISVLAKKSNLRQIKPQTLQIYKHSRNRRTCHVTR